MEKQVQKIVIVGAAESGVGAALLAKAKGFDVFVTDFGIIKESFKKDLLQHEIPFEEGGHNMDKVLSYDLMIKSPGVKETAPLVKSFSATGKSIISEIEFAARFTKAKLIGITGTNGKSTTTLLIYHLLQKAGYNVGLGGNIGKSFARLVLENDFDYYVLELSSFQLDGMYKTRLHVSILLNITPDHLDRYNYDLNQYVLSKMKILNNQEQADYFIYNADDSLIANAMKNYGGAVQKIPFSLNPILTEPSASIQDASIHFNLTNTSFTMSIHDLALQGKHNAYNSMAAGVAARVLEIRKEIIRESLSDFVNIEHRLETVTKVHGIEFINDSKATNVNSTWYALESMNSPVVWIVGGQDKGNDYEMLTALVKDKVKAIVCLGVDNSKIVKAFKGIVDQIEESGSAEEAVKKAYRLAKKGDIVLLSPACASFDLFENYEDRGHQFKQAVRSL
jgi:UDP-N-acetylmuramoylalanine--D-glutamate ligase